MQIDAKIFNKTLANQIQFSSVAQSCPTLCNPMDCIMTGFPVHHQLLEFIQTHVHWVCNAIQPSHPLSSPSPTFNHSQLRGQKTCTLKTIRCQWKSQKANRIPWSWREESILPKWLYYLRQSIDSMQSLLNCQWHFSQN